MNKSQWQWENWEQWEQREQWEQWEQCGQLSRIGKTHGSSVTLHIALLYWVHNKCGLTLGHNMLRSN